MEEVPVLCVLTFLVVQLSVCEVNLFGLGLRFPASIAA